MNRPLRRHARFHVHLSIGSLVVEGATSNVSAKGMYVRVPSEHLRSTKLDAGMQANVSFTLPGQSEDVRCLAELVWKNPNDTDARGSKAIGMGLRLVDVSVQGRERLDAFIKDFRYTVLIADSNVENVSFVKDSVGEDYNLVDKSSSSEVVEFLEREDVSVIVAGNVLRDMNGSDLLYILDEKLPHLRTERIRLVDAGSDSSDSLANVKNVLEAVKLPVSVEQFSKTLWHAVDRYAMKAEIDRLSSELDRRIRILEVEKEKLERENIYLQKRVEGSGQFGRLVGNSESLRVAVSQAEQIVSTDVRVYIQGETGTGKEVLARSIHENSHRADKPFLAVNCAEIPETLLQSTFFGHFKGAFTGATRSSLGVLRAADGGTVLLDEVSELPRAFQLTLLRVLQEGEVLPVGSSRKTKIDVRFISCSNKDLQKEVKSKRFREDLYYRLVVVNIEMPSLKNRREDIPLLVQHFLDLFCARHGKSIPGLTMGSMSALECYEWPGNIRELENEIERLVVSAQDEKPINLKHISPHIREKAPIDFSHATSRSSSMSFGDMCKFVFQRIAEGNIGLKDAIKDFEYKMMNEALKVTNGNRSTAARILKIPRSTLRSRLDKKYPQDPGGENSPEDG